ncbi:MAG: hypothetical protein ACOY4U_05685, partial [Pseudomonadota bacterium]
MATPNSTLQQLAALQWGGLPASAMRGPESPLAAVLSPFPAPPAEAANEPTLTLLTREQARTTERAVPVVSLKVAAGAFSAAQSLED